MKTLQSLKALLMIVPFLCAFTSCMDEDYLVYDAGYTGIYFTKDTLNYSFGVTPVETRTAEYRFLVRIMGQPVGQDRTFAYEVIADSTTATEGVQYVIGTPVVPADSVNGYIPVTILRDGLEGNYTDGYVRYKLGVRLLADGDFDPTLSEKEHIRVLAFDNAVEQPEWYDAFGDKVWSVKTFGVWHPLKFIKMVEYFHTLEDIQPATYEKMVSLYGENLEHVAYGDFYVYRTMMNKYVFYPMYVYFSDPANRDEILALYPDFPFDFPSPF